MNEIWKDIDGYEGLYEVSNLGKVKSLGNEFSRKEKILKQGKKKNGYLYVILWKEGKYKTCLVHRLVAQAFLENPNNYSCVNHKDENKENNCVENLEWCDAKYNINHGTCIQRRVANMDYKTKVANTDYKAIAEKLSRQVYQYDKNHNLIKIWKSVAEAGRNGYKQSTVSSCCLGKRKSHQGYIWSYTPL